MDKVFKFVLAFLLIPLVVAFVAVAWQMLVRNVPWGELQWALIGMLGYVLLYPLIRTNNLRFVEVFEHELAHMVTDLSVFHRMKEFHVHPGQKDGNKVVVSLPSGIPGTNWLS